jgi:hypothetical protein
MRRDYQQNIVLRRSPPSSNSISEGQIVFALSANKGLIMYTKRKGQVWGCPFYKLKSGQVIEDLEVRGTSRFIKQMVASQVNYKSKLMSMSGTSNNLAIEDSGSTIIFNSSTETRVYLPDSNANISVVGCFFNFIVTEGTGGPPKSIYVSDATNEDMYGSVQYYDDGDFDSIISSDGTKIKLTIADGATKGGINSHCTVTCVAQDKWYVTNANAYGVGGAATGWA